MCVCVCCAYACVWKCTTKMQKPHKYILTYIHIRIRNQQQPARVVLPTHFAWHCICRTLGHLHDGRRRE